MIDSDLSARIGAVEASLRRRFAAELAWPNWHGPTSYQRMIWQDREVLRLAATPGAAAVLLAGLARGRPLRIGPLTLAGALVAGLATNRPSYLFGACPNWTALPDVAGLTGEQLDDMRPPGLDRQTTPFQVTETLARAAGEALRSFAQHLVGELFPPDVGGELWSLIGHASPAGLIEALASLLTPSRLEALVHDPAVASTAVARLRGQCLEVMVLLPTLRLARDSDLETVLGFGLVSHGLDAKHLAAMLGGAPAPRGQPGAAVFDGLMSDLVTGRLEATPAALLTARLRQAVQLVANHAERLDITIDEVARALSP